jgi:hypothetical protein
MKPTGPARSWGAPSRKRDGDPCRPDDRLREIRERRRLCARCLSRRMGGPARRRGGSPGLPLGPRRARRLRRPASQTAPQGSRGSRKLCRWVTRLLAPTHPSTSRERIILGHCKRQRSHPILRSPLAGEVGASSAARRSGEGALAPALKSRIGPSPRPSPRTRERESYALERRRPPRAASAYGIRKTPLPLVCWSNRR